jgi:hypothetical protein
MQSASLQNKLGGGRPRAASTPQCRSRGAVRARAIPLQRSDTVCVRVCVGGGLEELQNHQT